MSTETATCVRESLSGRRHLYSCGRVEYSVATKARFKCAIQVCHNVIGPPQRFPGLGYSHPPSNPSKNGKKNIIKPTPPLLLLALA